MIEAIATDHIDRALEHAPGRDISLADVVDDFTGCKVVRWPACEALRHVDLARIEHGKQLMATSRDDAHLALSRPPPFHSSMQGNRTNSNSRHRERRAKPGA